MEMMAVNGKAYNIIRLLVRDAGIRIPEMTDIDKQSEKMTDG